MQTTTWTPVPPKHQSPTWPLAFAWWCAGFAGTVAAWSIAGITVAVLGRTAGWAVGYLLLIAGIVVLVRSSGRLARRYLIALVIGVGTPFVLAGVLIALVLVALANSNFTF